MVRFTERLKIFIDDGEVSCGLIERCEEDPDGRFIADLESGWVWDSVDLKAVARKLDELNTPKKKGVKNK